ncbi:MAG: patatin-like phospholipase family protein [Acetobacteraceae bacterium]
MSGLYPARRRFWRVFRWLLGGLAAAALCSVLAGFAWRPTLLHEPGWTPPSGTMQFGGGYRLEDFLGDPRAQVITALAFSGGGKGSAAFAHGVLRGMRQMSVPAMHGPNMSLLDQVEYISAVSGGSFAAAHYGVFRQRSFETFPAFLHADIDAEIRSLYLTPWHWVWLLRGGATDDYMAGVYDRLMFHGATYADMARQGAPVVSINATDLGTGASFPFTQEGFDLICAGLAPFQVSRAVAASNGLPVLFSPINLQSRRPGCPPVTVPPPPQDADQDELRRVRYIQEWVARFSDTDRVRYLHLVDGGIADNLALRALLTIVLTSDLHRIPQEKIVATRRLLLISVDGEAATDRQLSQAPRVNGLSVLAATVSGIVIDRYNFDTLLLADSEMRQLVRRLKEARCRIGPVLAGHSCDDVEGLVVHLDLRRVTDPAVRARLLATPLALTLPDDLIDLLVEWGARVVQEDAAIRRFLQGL